MSKTKILVGQRIHFLDDPEARYVWAKLTTDIFAEWVRYFGCPTCALIMCLIHEETYANYLKNDGISALIEPISGRAVAERLGISQATAHRKLNKVLNDKIFVRDGKFFGFAIDKDGNSVIRKELPAVGKKIDTLINEISKIKLNDALQQLDVSNT